MKPRVPALILLNQMAGPMTWELSVDLGRALGCVALLTGHPDTLKKKDTDESVQLYPATTYQRGNSLVRAWCWVRYTLHALVWVRRWPRTTPILAFSNPPIIPWACWLLHWIRGTPYAVMVHDIYPDTAVRLGAASAASPVVRVWSWLNRLAYSRAQVVMTLGEHMAGLVGQQFDATRTRPGAVIVVPPWADESMLRRIPKSENWFAQQYDQVGRWTVMYSGNMGKGHDIETILAVAERLHDRPAVHFMLIGAGPKWEMARQYVEQRKPRNLTLLPWQDESVIPFSLASADLAIVSLEPEMTGLAVPSKAYYFLAAGAPVLGICFAASELADMISQFHCGAVVRPGDVEGLSAIIEQAIAEPHKLEVWRKGAAEAARHFSRKTNTARFLDVLQACGLLDDIRPIA